MSDTCKYIIYNMNDTCKYIIITQGWQVYDKASKIMV